MGGGGGGGGGGGLGPGPSGLSHQLRLGLGLGPVWWGRQGHGAETGTGTPEAPQPPPMTPLGTTACCMHPGSDGGVGADRWEGVSMNE